MAAKEWRMRAFQQEAILRDEELTNEIARRVSALGKPAPQVSPKRVRAAIPELADSGVARRTIDDALENSFAAEAIVLRLGRPTLLVRNDTFEVPPGDTWRARLHPTKSKLDAAIRSVARVEVGGSSQPYIGTAWMIGKNVAVTNRHVALEFARRKGREFIFRSNPIGQPLEPRMDFKEEHAQLSAFEAPVAKVLYIAGLDDDDPDVAFMALRPLPGRPLPPPIPLFDGTPTPGQTVAVVGYPALDDRNSLSDQARLFGGIFDVKRLAPGEVMGRVDKTVFTHDATTLGGSSGSVVLDVATGAAVGLHFAGDFLDANFAVDVRTLRRLLAKVDSKPIMVDAAATNRPQPDGRVPEREVAGRVGYSETFLGTGALKVPLPTLSPSLAALAAVVSPGARGTKRFALPYTHFSIATHTRRRLALFTAVNIDGAQARKIKRKADKWSFDPRVEENAQVGNALYAGNDLDRGHLVRRLDPAWGGEDEANQAERDTFFYTNSTPQHAQFNQHLWLELEDYLLNHADTLDFRACIFTGPVFDDDDKSYRDVQLPRAYWKVAVMVHAEREALTLIVRPAS